MGHLLKYRFGAIALVLTMIVTPLFLMGYDKSDKPKTHTVEIYQMKFAPAVLTVQKGDTVVWVNRDYVEHDVTVDDKSWTSGPFGKGQKWSKVVTKSFDYYCSIHVVMKGKIKVEN